MEIFASGVICHTKRNSPCSSAIKRRRPVIIEQPNRSSEKKGSPALEKGVWSPAMHFLIIPGRMDTFRTSCPQPATLTPTPLSEIAALVIAPLKYWLYSRTVASKHHLVSSLRKL